MHLPVHYDRQHFGSAAKPQRNDQTIAEVSHSIKKNDGTRHMLHLTAADHREARIVAMETNAYVRRYPTSVDSILDVA